jgi:superfamily II DNA helicase RecQ
MLVRIFTLKFDPVVGGFDDSGLQNFVKDKEVLSIRDHFFTKDEVPYLVVLLTYNILRPEAGERPVQERSKEDKEKWRELLEEADWPLFNTLRDWRNNLAREEGIPPYVICTNRQLAVIAHRRPANLHKLSAIEGMGKAKLERYGAALLQIVKPQRTAQEEEKAEDGGSDDG